MRIAMWSGPRNLSTAMMYSFGARAGCAVWDEPFYGEYLARTGLAHPMAAQIIAAGEVDPAVVQARCLGVIPDDKQVFYQKHMVHHLQAGADQAWIADLVNVFLIRHPARVIASYHRKHEHPTLDDLGFRQQAELFEWLRTRGGAAPVVIDSADIRENPEAMLRLLCTRIGLAFDPAMLSWPAGGHDSDGVWASHWYNAVWKSTGFADAEGPIPQVPAELQSVLGQALPYYEQMAAHKISACCVPPAISDAGR